MLLTLAGLVLAAAAADAACSCPTAKAAGGWCAAHEVGWVAGVEIRSSFLFEVLDAHGHDVDLATFTCPACQLAIESDGYCDEHRVGFVDEKAYFSKLTHMLALGELRTAEEITCPVCRKNAETHGFCEACGIGMAGHIAIRGRAAYDEIEHEIRMLEAAAKVAERCGHCAAALLGNSDCPYCKIKYADGKPIAP